MKVVCGQLWGQQSWGTTLWLLAEGRPLQGTSREMVADLRAGAGKMVAECLPWGGGWEDGTQHVGQVGYEGDRCGWTMCEGTCWSDHDEGLGYGEEDGGCVS